MRDVGPVAALLLLCGEERHLVDGQARSWWAAARAASVSELNCEVLDSPTDLEAVARSLAEVPFLDDRRYVLLRDPPQAADRPRRGTASAEALVDTLRHRAPTTSLCIVVHTRLGPTHVLRRGVLATGGEVREYSSLRPRELRAWVEEQLRRRRLSLDRPGVEHLLAATGGDLAGIEGELDKLVAYADGRPHLDGAEVEAVVAGAEPVHSWAVVERLFSALPALGAEAVDAVLASGVAPAQLLATLATQVRELLLASDQAHQHGHRGPALVHRLAADLQLPPWRAERLAAWASQVSPEVVETWLRRLQRLDAGIKLGEIVDADGLRIFALTAAGERTGSVGGRAETPKAHASRGLGSRSSR